MGLLKMFIIIYVTHRDQQSAERVANNLLRKKLIACANFFPIKSLYWWDGKIENAKEFVSLLKAREGNWNRIKSEIEKIHPYKTPCIIKVQVEANKDYESWIKSI